MLFIDVALLSSTSCQLSERKRKTLSPLKTMSNILRDVMLNKKAIYPVNGFPTKRTFWCFENKRIDSEPSAQRTPQQIGLAERSGGVMFEMPTDAIMLHVINDNYR
ncbi:hypothetical protein V8E54_006577 [Elaphomyces granulatus]